MLGTAGASLAGYLVNTLGAVESNELNPWSLAASAFGAVLALAVAALVDSPSVRGAIPAKAPKARKTRR